MAQPTPYSLAYSFVGWQISNPARPLPSDKLEVEFHALETTTDEILANLALIQRDDGEVANRTIGYDQLKVALEQDITALLELGVREPTAWATATGYEAYDAVFNGNSLYRCLVNHTSGTFATDLAAAKWLLLATFTVAVGSVTWGVITGTLSAQTDLQAALDAKQPLDSDLTAIAALTTVAYGRALLETANEAALKALVNLEIGVDVQAYDAQLADIAGIAFAQGDILYHNGANVVALTAGTSGHYLKTQGAAANPVWAAVAGTGDLLAANNLSDLANAGTARTNLGLAIGTNVQAYDADLTTWAGLAPSANAQSFVTAADYAAMRVLLGLVIGTNVQAYDADLTTWAGLTPSANAQSFVTAADYAAMRVLLGLVIGTNVQAYDADLTTWAGLAPSANAQSFVTAADYAAMRVLLGLVIGTNVQAYDADLTTWAGLAPSANAQSLVTAADYSAMRTLLSLVPGTDVQAYDADLATIAGLTATTDNFIQSKSSAWASRTPAQVMVDLHVTPTIAEKTTAGAYTMLAADDHILVNKTVGEATTVGLVTAVGRVRPVKIVDMKGDAATNNITIDGNGTETIVSLTTYLIRNNYGSTTLWPKPDGSGWYI